MKEFSNGNIQTHVQNISEAIIPALRFHKNGFAKAAIIHGSEAPTKLWNSTQLFLYGATKAIEVSKPVKSSLESQMTSQNIPPCQHQRRLSPLEATSKTCNMLSGGMMPEKSQLVFILKGSDSGVSVDGVDVQWG